MLRFGFKRKTSKGVCDLWDNASFENGLDGWEAIDGGTLTLEADGTVTVTGGIRRTEPVDIGKILLLVYADIRSGQPTLRFRNIEDNTIDIMQQYEAGVTTYTAIPNEGVWGIELVGNFNIAIFASRSLSGCDISDACEVSLPHSGWTYIDGDAENVELVVDGISILRNIPTVVEGTLEHIDGTFRIYRANELICGCEYHKSAVEVVKNSTFLCDDLSYIEAVGDATFNLDGNFLKVQMPNVGDGILIRPYKQLDGNNINASLDLLLADGTVEFLMTDSTLTDELLFEKSNTGISVTTEMFTPPLDNLKILSKLANNITIAEVSARLCYRANNICMNDFERDGYSVTASEYIDEYYPWKAFNCTLVDSNDAWAIPYEDGVAKKPAWIEFEYPFEVQLEGLDIDPRAGMDTTWYKDNNPYSFALEIDGVEVDRRTMGWNDGSRFVYWFISERYVGRRFRFIIYNTQKSASGGTFHTAIGRIGIRAVNITGEQYASHKIPHYNPIDPEPRD